MSKYSPEFKEQAVKKALSRNPNQSVSEIAEQLQVARSTLWKWIKQAKDNQLTSTETMSKEKSPQNWTTKERFEALLKVQTLNEKQQSIYCREKGIYPHHLKQWKADFIHHQSTKKGSSSSTTTTLKKENTQLKKELRRKEKALAETAALLVLSKKCQAFWETPEDV